jgi:gluconate 2-dehydrogenase gamma chain
MKNNETPRREFLLRGGGLAAAAWMNAQWPGILAAAQHAHEAAKSSSAAHFEVLTPEQARNVQAIASQIIPSDELPGAREAGVVYFIDRALKTFAKSSLHTYQQGIAEVNQLVAEKFSGVKSFADASPEQQHDVMAILMEQMNQAPPRRGLGSQQLASADFIQTIWQHTLWGFLADPEAGGNRDYVGWKVVGRDPAHSFSPPFGFYDKDYPGWQPATSESVKK